MGPFLTAESSVGDGYIAEILMFSKNRLRQMTQTILCKVLIYRYFSGMGILGGSCQKSEK